ncbi:MAG TPA: HAD hydrolase family protein [Candidatus Acidoferrales bacterium]|jgi:3-deoxy-D-manno-octulosonate 8-phosphate phosphatase (KDO 8-P phosphatase)|nr:HAD hydrolase family protein [Candidatus Acidoferrales bacterium]
MSVDITQPVTQRVTQLATQPATLPVTQLASKIRLLLMDVDGVLTDGKLYNVPAPDGWTAAGMAGSMAETKGFDSQDGIALQWLNRIGIAAGVISGRESPATAERAKQVKFKYVYQGHTEKIPILQEIMADARLEPSQVAYIGDDFTDVVVMRRVGLAIATANARPEVKAIAHYVTQVPGGQGAVREVVELLLQAQGRWDEILRHYEICL